MHANPRHREEVTEHPEDNKEKQIAHNDTKYCTTKQGLQTIGIINNFKFQGHWCCG